MRRAEDERGRACWIGRRFEANPALKPAGAEPHGGYTFGVNKDAYSNPRWRDGYVAAFIETMAWLKTIEGWVRRGGGARR